MKINESKQRAINSLLYIYNWKDAFADIINNEKLYNSASIKVYYPQRTIPEKQGRFLYCKSSKCYSIFQLANIAIMNCKQGDFIPCFSNGISFLEFVKFTQKSVIFKTNSNKIKTFKFNSYAYTQLLKSLEPFITTLQLGYARNIGTLQKMIERDEATSVTSDNIYRIENYKEFQLRIILQKILKFPVIINKHLNIQNITKSFFAKTHPRDYMTINTKHWYGKRYWLQPSPVKRYRPNNLWLTKQNFKKIVLPEKLDTGFQVWKEVEKGEYT